MLMIGSAFLHVELHNGCSYQHTKYHKQTKNQWARDDPAFIVVCSLLLAVSSLAYCAAFLTNNYLLEEAPNSHVVEQRVEWQVRTLCISQSSVIIQVLTRIIPVSLCMSSCGFVLSCVGLLV
ncbi:UNC-50 family protein [Actinidia rufa]|uniref:UNC-50 family protein n=1 Tax=Actinidia rufa TaxID=165716 RepID=A0A7J0ESV8_9ERIC|nr:UNC-50 family protein [Actinidia rufa]